MTGKIAFLIITGFLLYSCTKNNSEDFNSIKEGAVRLDSVIVVPTDYEYPGDSTFKILSWNVEHFVDPYDDPYINHEREDTPPANMPLRLSLFLSALKKANADIVVLQEFESAKYLKQLALDSLPDMEYRYFADIPSHNWYMNVVVMSRFPMGIIYGYGNVTTPLPGFTTEEGGKETQNHINTRMWSIDIFPAEDYSFLLTGAHLKAGRGDRDIAMRKGQLNLLVAQFNRMLLEDQDKNILVAGDLNATPNSEEIALLLNNDKLKDTFIDPIDTAIYSHPANAPTRRLDYMLVNENMHSEAVQNSIKVGNYFSSDTMEIISDHLPVTGRFYNEEKSNMVTQ